MFPKLYRILAMFLFVALAPLALAAGDFDAELHAIQDEWAVIKYDMPAKEQAAAYERLLERSERFTRSHPDRAEPLIWDAIVRASYAGAKGGFGALSHAKRARKELERAIEIDPTALAGSAYTTLGSLYHKVPGWPIGFGSDKRAKENFEKALALNPQGIDPNYFYGEFLLDTGHGDEAVAVLERALAAPDRPGRAHADAGRRHEIRALLARAKASLAASQTSRNSTGY